jgi:hypothetical protein
MHEKILAVFKEKAHERINIDISLFELFCIVGNIELALRHPENKGPSSEIMKAIACILAKKIINECPEVLEYDDLTKGWINTFGITF